MKKLLLTLIMIFTLSIPSQLISITKNTNDFDNNINDFERLKEKIQNNMQIIKKTLNLSSIINMADYKQIKSQIISKLKHEIKIADNLGPKKPSLIEKVLSDSLTVLFLIICDINLPSGSGNTDFKSRIKWLRDSLVIFYADIYNFLSAVNRLSLNCDERKELRLDYLDALSSQSLSMIHFIDQKISPSV